MSNGEVTERVVIELNDGLGTGPVMKPIRTPLPIVVKPPVVIPKDPKLPPSNVSAEPGPEPPVEIFGEFHFGSNGKVRAVYTTTADPPQIVAPLGTEAKNMVFAEKDGTAYPKGIVYLYYEGEWDKLPDFSTLAPAKVGIVENFTLDVRLRDDHFALLFNGFIDIQSDGEYTFYTASHDESRFWIGSKLVVENDAIYDEGGLKVGSGKIQLVRGKHEITLAFFKKTGAAVLEVHFQGPGFRSTTKIPDDSLFRSDALYLYRAGNYRPALNRTPGSFSLPYAHQDARLEDQRPLFYEDAARTFFVKPGKALIPVSTAMKTNRTYIYTFGSVRPQGDIDVQDERLWKFQTHYHPYTCIFIRELNRYGVPGLFNRKLQSEPQTFLEEELRQPLNFLNEYQPVASVVDSTNFPADNVDFSFVSSGGAYSLYNWELFFHAPLMIADRLSKNQRFEEAQQWFHYIFDPTALDRFWRFKPFQNVVQESIQELLAILASDQDTEKKRELLNKVDMWRDNPFNTHLIARLRISAYQKTVVMKYIDNLIAWADQLFRRDTIESINEATLLYVLAAELLGPRPQAIKVYGESQPKTFAELDAAQDDFLVRIESVVPTGSSEPGNGGGETPELLTAPYYFCIPKNETLLGYWDTVADRLFKVRHCMNIEGIVRQLPLFEPPIEPGMLVRAAAAGVDISSILNDVSASLPHYRFRVMAQKATELCADLKSLGSSLLSALEKRDAEALARLRSGQEIQLLEAVKQVRERQINEAKETLEGLQLSRKVTEIRRDYYRDIAKISQNEQYHMDLLGMAHVFSEIAQGINAGAAAAHLVPNFDVGISGWCGTPVAKAAFGGSQLGSALQAAAGILSMISAQHTHDATMASIKGGYDRRWNDWKLQEKMADKELEQIDKQILAAEIRAELAEKELQNQELQIENAKQADTLMHKKFTNWDLYDWMVAQISGTYFYSYQMAYDIAKRAQRAFQYECGVSDTFIEFGYWDNLKKGLLAGEKLHYDLKRMEVAYLDQNRRDYEITKHISLAMIDPAALLMLKQTGECFVDLPEELFDMDYPGHYLRRIKTLNVSIPCITGPYTSVNCTVTLLWNTVRRNALLVNGAYARERTSDGLLLDDSRFMDSIGAIQSIVTSSGREDSGLFEQNMQDERYLPFEGAGAVSRWRIQAPKNTNQFDFSTITDVVLSLRYTAREGGELLRTKAMAHLTDRVKQAGTLFRVFSGRHNFPDAWHRFLTPAPSDPQHVFDMKELRKYVPSVLGSSDLEIKSLYVILGIKDGIKYEDSSPLKFCLDKDKTRIGEYSLKLHVKPVEKLPAAQVLSAAQELDNSTWRVSINKSHIEAIEDGNPTLVAVESTAGTTVKKLNPDAIEDIWFILAYGLKNAP
jgi:Tc toxin complex TcA C-terminal TcB-binding domain/PA14 domain